MSGNLLMSVQKDKDRIIVKLSGEVDIYSVPDFKESLYKVVEEESLDVELECAELTYIDSSGLGILVGALKRVKQNGNKVYISMLRDNVRKLFLITGLDKVFELI